MVSVVLVDDDVSVRTMLRMLLARDGRLEIVGEAGDGQAGLQVVTDHDPDVLLLDLAMPVMNGLEVLSQLTERNRPRVAVLTGLADDSVRTEVLAAGADRFLVKGTDFDGLADVVVELAS